jgi:hypothetical protein
MRKGPAASPRHPRGRRTTQHLSDVAGVEPCVFGYSDLCRNDRAVYHTNWKRLAVDRRESGYRGLTSL